MRNSLHKLTFPYLFGVKSYIFYKKILRYTSRLAYTNSFQYRILNYFENQLNLQKSFNKYEVSSQISEEVLIVKKARQTFVSIVEEIHQLSDSQKYLVTNVQIAKIDKKCVSILTFLKHSEILYLLMVFLKFLPSKLVNTDFYNESLKILYKALENELLGLEELSQFLFYIALKKDENKRFMKYMRSYLPDIQNLPLMDKCILAQTFYKSSTELEINQSQIYEQLIEEKCEELILDPVLLVAVCKIIRISSPSKKLLLKNLSNKIIELKQPFDFITSCHLVCLYASALVYEPNAVQYLVKNSLSIIREDDSKLRLKDIDRFFWSTSHLGYLFTLDEKIILLNYITKRFGEYKQRENLGILVNSLLCLYILQCWNGDSMLISKCLTEGIFQLIINDKIHWKIRSRLQLLLSAIDIESKYEIPQSLQKQIKISHTVSKEIMIVAEVGQRLMEKGILKNVVVECPVNNLQIPGVTFVFNKMVFHVDVYNDLTCLKNTYIPHGLMKFKHHLLSIKYCKIIIPGYVFDNQIEAKNEIERIILKKITTEQDNDII